MAELNKIILIGRLTKDPDLRYTPGGAAVCEMRLASNHTFYAKEEKRSEVCFVDVSLFGKAGETAKKYLAKGREILVEGRLQWQEWDGQDGQKRSKHRIVADRFQFIGSGAGREDRQAEGSNAEEAPAEPDSGSEGTSRPVRGRDAPAAAEEQEAGDELPF